MARKTTYSLVTVTREGGKVTDAVFDSNLTREDLTSRLSKSVGKEDTRTVFVGEPVPWAPSVQLGEPRKRKAKMAEKPAKPSK